MATETASLIVSLDGYRDRAHEEDFRNAWIPLKMKQIKEHL